ncbi:MAG: hypothetical protein ABFD58_08700, partial [Anaerolineaceae bacterium]
LRVNTANNYYDHSVPVQGMHSLSLFSMIDEIISAKKRQKMQYVITYQNCKSKRNILALNLEIETYTIYQDSSRKYQAI